MSRTPTASFLPSSNKQKQQTYYIVKDDFITNLRKGRRHRSQTQPIEQRQPTFIRESCVIVNKKKQIQGKLPFRSHNDFYELDKQIQNNSRSLYRKMTVAMRQKRSEYQGKLSNPFSQPPIDQKSTKNSFNQEKNLSDLIYYVQPYWIKKYISKTSQDSKFD